MKVTGNDERKAQTTSHCGTICKGIPAEQKEMRKCAGHQRITENGHHQHERKQTEGLLEQILTQERILNLAATPGQEEQGCRRNRRYAGG